MRDYILMAAGVVLTAIVLTFIDGATLRLWDDDAEREDPADQPKENS